MVVVVVDLVVAIVANIGQILHHRNFYPGLTGQDVVDLFMFTFVGGQDQWYVTSGYVT